MLELEKCISSPEVAVRGSFELRGREVTRFDCVSCGRCALVPNIELGTDSMPGQLQRGNFCAAAIGVAKDMIS